MNVKFGGGVLSVLFLTQSVCGDPTSIGPNGINATATNLTGDGIAIGQVEDIRPGKPGFDDPGIVNTAVEPTGVFLRDGAATVNTNVGDHATGVAGVMISTDAVTKGVATDADLYSSAYGNTSGVVDFYQKASVAMQHVATQNSDDVPAVNLSFGGEAIPMTPLDGNSLLTSFVDWSAREHDTLYVVAGENSGIQFPIPTDNFNGVTVGNSSQVGGVYRQVGPLNSIGNSLANSRNFIDLIAPGTAISVPEGNETDDLVTGTSFATPHVTGTVALLQEHAEAQIAASTAGWGENARKHLVSKVVLMNSVDKIEDNGNGHRLGMTRDVLTQGGDTWLDSAAYTDSTTPLDIEMGTGHLNAKRALEQFQGGETDGYEFISFPENRTPVPNVGWDYDNTLVDGLQLEYEFEDPLPAGSFVSITLAWDRLIELDVDGGTADKYDVGDTFTDNRFSNLDIQLHMKGAEFGDPPVAVSDSTTSNLEHLFFQIPTTGIYEFWVAETDFDVFPGTDFAVAWWAFNGPTEEPVAGDFDGNGTIGPEDYVAWRGSYGSTVTPGSGADGNGDGVIDAADYTVWRDNLPAMAATAGPLAAAPEPNALAMLLAGLLAGSARLRQR